MSKAKQLIFLLVVVLGAAVLWHLFSSVSMKEDAEIAGQGEQDEEVRRQPVIVQEASFESGASTLMAVGTGQAQQSITLYPESAGQVREILFSAGQEVEQGDLLLSLDKEDEELLVELAKLRLEDARQRLQRYERAAPSGAVSASEVDQARIDLSVAQIELAQAELAHTKRMLLAPFDGVIGISQVDPGDRITESTAIATLDDLTNLLVDFRIPEAYAYAIEEGQEVEAQTWALPGVNFTGTVTSLGSQIEQETRTLQVRARLPNEQGRLRTGMSFVMELSLSGELYPAVPAVSVQWDREAAYVWRIRDGQAERQTVEVLKRANGWALLSAQLTREDQVVVEGMQSLREGMSVEVRQRQGDTADLSTPETTGKQNDG